MKMWKLRVLVEPVGFGLNPNRIQSVFTLGLVFISDLFFWFRTQKVGLAKRTVTTIRDLHRRKFRRAVYINNTRLDPTVEKLQ